MITVYQVSYQEDSDDRYTFPTPHLFRQQAESHICWLKKAGADNPQMTPIEIDEIANQKIIIKGDIVGYQFSRFQMGKRTETRKVYDLEMGPDGGLIGKGDWKGRVLKVALDGAYLNWIAVDLIGYKD